MLTAAPLFGMSALTLELGAIVYLTLSVVICAAIPLTTGIGKGHVTLGIIAALITIPSAIMLTCIGGLLVGGGLSVLISFIPKVERPLLSQSEVEAEMRRIRGY